jgi:hypothetical protein
MRSKRVAAVATFVLGMALNPAAFWGCGDGDQPVYNFGQPELLALLDSVQESSGWQRDKNGTSYVVEVELARAAQAGVEPAGFRSRGRGRASTLRSRARGRAWTSASTLFARPAHACGTRTRTFASSAAACDTRYETKLPLAGTVTLLSSTGGVTTQVGHWQVTGELVVDGLDLSMASSISVNVEGEGVALDVRGGRDGFELSSLKAGALLL